MIKTDDIRNLQLIRQLPQFQKAAKEFDDLTSHQAIEVILNKYASKEVLSTIATHFFSNLDELFNSIEIPYGIYTEENAECYYEKLIDDLFSCQGEDGSVVHSYRNINMEFFISISILLYNELPEYFYPNLFPGKIEELYKLCNRFGIESLPPVPNKLQYRKRALYYWECCKAFTSIRNAVGFSPSEMCAFLYYYVPYIMANEAPDERTIAEEELPQPTNAWFIGGEYQPEELDQQLLLWQANEDTRKGDLLFFYQKGKCKALNSLWRAGKDGIADPFFHYYGSTYITNKTELPSISFDEFVNDTIFSSFSLARKKFQGVNGWKIPAEYYHRLLELLQAKGFDVNSIPKLFAPTLQDGVIIKDESDVENYRIKPILESLGWISGRDYIQQLPIRTGRKESERPDFFLHYTRGKHSYQHKAKVVIEAKMEIKTNRQLEKDFGQLKSYSDHVHPTVIALADKEGLYIYRKKHGDFLDWKDYTLYRWAELSANSSYYDQNKYDEVRKLFS